MEGVKIHKILKIILFSISSNSPNAPIGAKAAVGFSCAKVTFDTIKEVARAKRKRVMMITIRLISFLIGDLGEPNIYHDLF